MKQAFTREKEITINELGDMKIYPINEEKCGIAFDYKNYYLCDLSKMEITLKIELISIQTITIGTIIIIFII